MSKRTRTVQNSGGTPVHVTGYGDVAPYSEPVDVPASENVDWLLEHGALVETAAEAPTSDAPAGDAEPSKTSRRRSTGGTRASDTTPAADSESKETP